MSKFHPNEIDYQLIGDLKSIIGGVDVSKRFYDEELTGKRARVRFLHYYRTHRFFENE